MSQNKFCFGKIEINNLSFEEIAQKIQKCIQNNKKGYVITPNVWHIVLLQKDNQLLNVYKNALLVVCDSQVLIWVSKIFGNKIKCRVTGCELLYLFAELAEQQSYKVFLLGASQKTINIAQKKLKYQFPNLNIVGYLNGYFTDDNYVINEINKLQPDILFIGMGSPNQEKWIYKNINKLNKGVAFCIGGVFEIVAGNLKRAPKFIQNIGLEWFWRLIQEPKRLWKRYLIGNTVFLWLVLKELMKKRVLILTSESKDRR